MFEHTTEISAPRSAVYEWHTRAGALTRLVPPWQRIQVLEQTRSLRDGRSVLRLPGGIRWIARHRPEGFREGFSFQDDLTSLPLAPLLGWRHHHDFVDAEAGRTRIVDRVHARMPRRALTALFDYRGRQLSDDLRAHRDAASFVDRPLTVAVTGSRGLIGSALCALLTSGGHTVVRLVRNTAQRADQRRWNPASPADDLLEGIDVVVHLAGEPIAARFTPRHRADILDSRVEPTRRLSRLAARGVRGRPVRFISASAIGYYGPDRGDTELTEDSERGDGFLADVVDAWETAAQTDDAATVIRTGIVQTPAGGTLRMLLPLFTVGFGGRLSTGRQWTSWIGIDDLLDVYLHAIVDDRIHGPLNAVAPNPVRNSEYTATLAAVLRRPALLPVPDVGPRVLLGRDGADEIALAGQRVRPARLEALQHRYRFPELGRALRHVLGR